MSFQKITEHNLPDLVRHNLSFRDDDRHTELLQKFTDHALSFVREAGLTHAEWMAAIEFLREVAEWTDQQRNEFILLSDCLGISAMVDLISDRSDHRATSSTGLGPFYVPCENVIENDASIISAKVPGPQLWFRMRVLDTQNNPIKGCDIDVWQAHADGLYDVQENAGMNMRGKLRSDDDGYAAFVGVMPNGYPLPSDGPVYQHLGRHKPSTVRPAHIHLIASAEGYEPLVTHVFPENDGHLLTDPVFGVRDDLVIPFTKVDKLIGNEPTAIIGPYWTATFELRLSQN